MKELKVLKSCLKGRKKIVEALIVVFMITGGIQSFGDTFVSNNPDDISIDADMTGDVFGDYNLGEMDSGSIDTITVKDGVTVEGSIYGEYAGEDIGKGGVDYITLDEGSTSSTIYGEYAGGDIETGGIDYITLSEGSSYGSIYGEYAKGDIGTGGADVIVLDNATTNGTDLAIHIGSIFGEYAKGSIEIGGADKIKLMDYELEDGVLAEIFGEYTEEGLGEGGVDEITVTNSSLCSIYGEFSADNIEIAGGDIIDIDNSNIIFDISGEAGGVISQGGDDKITLRNQSTVSGIYGDVAYINLEKGGADTIIVDNSTVKFGVYGDYGVYGEYGTIKDGGADTIIIKNGSDVEGVYGEAIWGKGESNIIFQGGDDEIIIEDSNIVGSVYGEQTFDTDTWDIGGTIIAGGDDTFTLVGATTVGGIVSGGRDGSGIVAGRDSRDSEEIGDYDTLNLSAYTTDFTTLNYEGIEEVNLVDNTSIDLGDGPYTSNESVIFNVEIGSSITADNGEYTMNTSLTNNGIIDLIGDSGNIIGDKFTIDGDFSGDGGILKLDMNAMDLTSDMIVVKGDFTGTQLINPTMVDTETEFNQRVVDFMEVEGANDGQIGFTSLSRSSGMITKGRVSGSAFEWDIRSDDTSNMWSLTTVQGVDVTLPPAPERPESTTDPSTPDGGGSTGGGETVVLPELPGYASLQNIGEDMIHSNVDSLYTRLGDIRRYKAENEGESLTKDKVVQDDDYMELSREGVTVWTRATAEYFDYEANDDAYGYDGDVSGFDIGADYTFELSRDTAVVAGLLYGKRYGNFETSTSDEGKYVVAESADIDMDSWSLAAYGTFIYKDNTYLDLVAGYTDYESDIDAPGLNDSVDGDAIWGSAEVGHSFQVGDIWRVEPQLQLTYTEVDFDDTTNDVGTEVEYSSNNQLTGRIGTIVSAGIPINEVAQVRPWFGVSVLQEFMDPEDVTYGGTDFEGQDIDTYMEYKIGVQVDLNKAVGMYVEGKYQTDYDDYDSYRGTLGVKYSF